MITARFRSAFSDDWTDAALAGDEESSAWNILCTRLLSLDYEVEVWDGEEWLGAEESLDE